jgi:hypothetical protein
MDFSKLTKLTWLRLNLNKNKIVDISSFAMAFTGLTQVTYLEIFLNNN